MVSALSMLFSFALAGSDLFYDDPSKPMKPPLLLIGAMKCGTTSMAAVLTKHPEIHAPVPFPGSVRWAYKEVHYFSSVNVNLNRTRHFYMHHFPDKPGLKGYYLDATPNYLLKPMAASHMKKAFPDADLRMVAILRDPIDRFISQHDHQMGAARNVCKHSKDTDRGLCATNGFARQVLNLRDESRRTGKKMETHFRMEAQLTMRSLMKTMAIYSECHTTMDKNGSLAPDTAHLRLAQCRNLLLQKEEEYLMKSMYDDELEHYYKEFGNNSICVLSYKFWSAEPIEALRIVEMHYLGKNTFDWSRVVVPKSSSSKRTKKNRLSEEHFNPQHIERIRSFMAPHQTILKEVDEKKYIGCRGPDGIPTHG